MRFAGPSDPPAADSLVIPAAPLSPVPVSNPTLLAEGSRGQGERAPDTLYA
jgi:hypothetical protein